jgi:polyphosphate kinase
MKKIALKNKELSWLAFNERVLQEAENPQVPLVERIKFLGIFSNNQDEFFRVRVATLRKFAEFTKGLETPSGEKPEKILEKIYRIVLEQQKRVIANFNACVKELENHQIYLVNEKQLNEEQTRFVFRHFSESVRPKIFPIILSKDSRLGELRDDNVYLVIDLLDPAEQVKRTALLKIPTDMLDRFIELPSVGENRYIILLDDVIRLCLHEIFDVIQYTVKGAYTFKFTRDAELDIQDDLDKSYLEKIDKGIRKRIQGQTVRFVYDKEMPIHLLKQVTRLLNINSIESGIAGGRYHNFKDFINFPDLGKKELRYVKWEPIRHRDLIKHHSMFSILKQRDLLLHFPYHPFIHILDLLREAAIDPSVKSIAITIYRVAYNSSVMNALINASRNGKQVTAILELQARFNEESNIYWSKRLEASGVKVIFGVPGLKVHSKALLIKRKEDKKLVQYAAIGTGNFNEDTAKVFSDIFLLTSNTELTSEVDKIFRFFSSNYIISRFKHLLVAPFNIRYQLNKLIQDEIKAAKAGKPAAITLKMNNLVDAKIITKLYEAKNAGVSIRLMVRGMFSLIPRHPGMKGSIPAVAIIDRYLEHARIFHFHNQGKDLIFISSADLMERNLDRRVEVICPIYDTDLKAYLIQIMEMEWMDNTQARKLDNDLSNTYRKSPEGEPFQLQQKIYEMLKALMIQKD